MIVLQLAIETDNNKALISEKNTIFFKEKSVLLVLKIIKFDGLNKFKILAFMAFSPLSATLVLR